MLTVHKIKTFSWNFYYLHISIENDSSYFDGSPEPLTSRIKKKALIHSGPVMRLLLCRTTFAYYYSKIMVCSCFILIVSLFFIILEVLRIIYVLVKQIYWRMHFFVDFRKKNRFWNLTAWVKLGIFLVYSFNPSIITDYF